MVTCPKCGYVFDPDEEGERTSPDGAIGLKIPQSQDNSGGVTV